MICATNAIKNLHLRLRKIAKSRSHFPSNDWGRTAREWKAARVNSTSSMPNTQLCPAARMTCDFATAPPHAPKLRQFPLSRASMALHWQERYAQR